MLIIVAIAIAIAATGFMAWWVRLRGGPTDPFPNWWPQFEREFRAYAAHRAYHNHTINERSE